MWMNNSWRDGCVVCLNSRGSPAEEVQISLCWSCVEWKRANMQLNRRSDTWGDSPSSVSALNAVKFPEERESSKDMRASKSQPNKVFPPNSSVLSEFCPPACVAFQESGWQLAAATRQSSQRMSLKHCRCLWSTLRMKEQETARETACGCDTQRREVW